MEEQVRPILVGFDGSTDAELAVEWAARWGALTGLPLRVVVVSPDPDRLPLEMREIEERHAELTARAAEDLLARSATSGSEVVRSEGSPLEVLRSEADGASLVVVGSSGHGPVERHVLGSVSHHLAGHVHLPVVVVRPAANPQAREIVVGIDGSETSSRALRFAAEHAALTGEDLVVVHAYQYPTYLGWGQRTAAYAGGLAVDPARIHADVETAGEALASQAIEALAADFPDLSVRSLATAGPAAAVLTRMSEDASLVVVGARGLNAWGELLMGSTSQQALHRAECPVVVVR
jgi:nucleotide-binding universal stress UspA family protein